MNFNPVAIHVGTGAYTIPASQFAYVSVCAKNGQTFTLNGTTVLSTDDLDIAAFSASTNGGNTVHPVGAGRIGVGQVYSRNGTANIDGTNGTTDALSEVTLSGAAGPGGNFQASGGSGANQVSGYEMGRQNTTISGNYWLPTGTVLGGTATYCVSLYNA